MDGRNRVLACLRLRVEPEGYVYQGPTDEHALAAFVWSLNGVRRHLNESQRARIAADFARQFEAAARARQGTRTDISANWREGEGRKAANDAARMANVGIRSVARAMVVRDRAVPELDNKVKDGAVSVFTAADVATLPAEEQQMVVAREAVR